MVSFHCEDLNDFILNFSYGYAELKDKPVPISQEDLKEPKANLGETAAQMWLLSRIFPFFGHNFSHDYPDVWRTLMTMLEITGICLSDIFTATSVTVHGTCFKKDLNTILLAQMTDSQPVFGSLESVWPSATHVFFGLKLYKTADFSIDLNAYRIEEEEIATGLFVIEVSDLLMTSVMHIYKYERSQYVCPREDPAPSLIIKCGWMYISPCTI